MEPNEIFEEIQEKEIDPLQETKKEVEQKDQEVRSAAEQGEETQKSEDKSDRKRIKAELSEKEFKLSEKEFKRFERALEGLFNKQVPSNDYSDIAESVKEHKSRIYLDNANVLGIHFKNSYLEKWFNGVFDVSAQKYPELDYSVANSQEITSKYSMEYISKIVNIFKIFESVEISMNRDFPITFENEYIKIVLAPKIEN